METIIDAFNRLFDFANSGIYDFIHAAFVQIQYYFVIWSIKAKTFLLSTSWEVSKTLLANFGISSSINGAWSSLNGSSFSLMTLLKIPESLNIIIQAYITKFSMRLL